MSFLKHLPPFWRGTEKSKSRAHGAILEALNRELTDAEEEAIKSKALMHLETATGEWLDHYGRVFGVLRRDLESDEVYRARIKGYITLERGTIPSIIAAIRNFLQDFESHITVYEPFRNVITLNSSELNSEDGFLGDYYRHAVIDVQFTEPFPVGIIDIINEFKPAGVEVNLSYYPSKHTDGSPVLSFPLKTSETKEINTKAYRMSGLNDRIKGHMYLTDKTPEHTLTGTLFTLNNSRLNSQDWLVGSFAARNANANYHYAIHSKEDVYFDITNGISQALDAFMEKTEIKLDNLLKDTYRERNIYVEDSKATLQKYELNGEDRNILRETTFDSAPRTWNVHEKEIIEGIPNAVKLTYNGPDNAIEEYDDELGVYSGALGFNTNSSELNSLHVLGGGTPKWGMIMRGTSPLIEGQEYTLAFKVKTESYLPSVNYIRIIQTGQEIPGVGIEHNGEWGVYKTTFVAEQTVPNFSIFLGFEPDKFPETTGGYYSTEDDEYLVELDGDSYHNEPKDKVIGGDFLDRVEFSQIHLSEKEPDLWLPAPEDGVEWYHPEGVTYVRPINVSSIESYMTSRFDFTKMEKEGTEVELHYSYNNFNWIPIEEGDSLNKVLGEGFQQPNIYIRVRMKTDNQYRTPSLDDFSLLIEGKYAVGEILPEEFYTNTGTLGGDYASYTMGGGGTEYAYYILDAYTYLELNYDKYLKEISNRGTYKRDHYLELLQRPVILHNHEVSDPNVEVKLQIYNIEANDWEDLTNHDPKAREDVEKLFLDDMGNYLTDKGLVLTRLKLTPIQEAVGSYEIRSNYFELGFYKEVQIRTTTEPYIPEVRHTRVIELFSVFDPDRLVNGYHYNNTDHIITEDIEFVDFIYGKLTPRRAIYLGGEFGDEVERTVSGGKF